MEFYITFKEFKENYEKDLTERLNTYPDATETEYLQFLKKTYKNIRSLLTEDEVTRNGIFKQGKRFLVKNGSNYEQVSGSKYAEILEAVELFSKTKNYKEFSSKQEYLKMFADIDVNIDKSYRDAFELKSLLLGEYSLIKEQHSKYTMFFDIKDDRRIFFDEKKYINFEFSINRIFEFIDNRLEELKNPPQQTETETKQQKYSNPLKVKILDELNVQGWLLEKGFTVTQIQYLLSDLFDVTDKSIRNYFKDQKYTDKAKTIINEIKNSKSDR